MVDDVEDILREIADRVRAEQAMSPISQPNGQSANDELNVVQRETSELPVKATLARLEANLTTTGRAWDRLPPIVSKRTGAVARLELRIKRFLKRATRWYSWEQVNFNAAVHHALRDTLTAISSLEVELQNVRRQAVAERDLLNRYEAELRAVERELESGAKKLDSRVMELEQRTELQRQQLESQTNEIAAQRGEFEALTSQVQARLSELSVELRERSDKLLDEQRVSFKQLALELSEVGTLVDRGRRDLEMRFEKVEKAKSKSR